MREPQFTYILSIRRILGENINKWRYTKTDRKCFQVKTNYASYIRFIVISRIYILTIKFKIKSDETPWTYTPFSQSYITMESSSLLDINVFPSDVKFILLIRSEFSLNTLATRKLWITNGTSFILIFKCIKNLM